MAFDNARQRFQDAVRALVDEPGRIKDRLLVAYASQLSRIDLRQDLPADAMNEFEGLRFVLSDADMPYGYGEHAAKRVADLSEEEASAVARRIYALFLRLAGLGA